MSLGAVAAGVSSATRWKGERILSDFWLRLEPFLVHLLAGLRVDAVGHSVGDPVDESVVIDRRADAGPLVAHQTTCDSVTSPLPPARIARPPPSRPPMA